MTNTYYNIFTATCPNNGQNVTYRLIIETTFTVMIEDIQEHCDEASQLGKPYHETMADYLHAKIGGKHTMIAFHHGVWIKTVRGVM